MLRTGAEPSALANSTAQHQARSAASSDAHQSRSQGRSQRRFAFLAALKDELRAARQRQRQQQQSPGSDAAEQSAASELKLPAANETSLPPLLPAPTETILSSPEHGHAAAPAQSTTGRRQRSARRSRRGRGRDHPLDGAGHALYALRSRPVLPGASPTICLAY